LECRAGVPACQVRPTTPHHLPNPRPGPPGAAPAPRDRRASHRRGGWAIRAMTPTLHVEGGEVWEWSVGSKTPAPHSCSSPPNGERGTWNEELFSAASSSEMTPGLQPSDRWAGHFPGRCPGLVWVGALPLKNDTPTIHPLHQRGTRNLERGTSFSVPSADSVLKRHLGFEPSRAPAPPTTNSAKPPAVASNSSKRLRQDRNFQYAMSSRRQNSAIESSRSAANGRQAPCALPTSPHVRCPSRALLARSGKRHLNPKQSSGQRDLRPTPFELRSVSLCS
jgi:hypothetical protein